MRRDGGDLPDIQRLAFGARRSADRQTSVDLGPRRTDSLEFRSNYNLLRRRARARELQRRAHLARQREQRRRGRRRWARRNGSGRRSDIQRRVLVHVVLVVLVHWVRLLVGQLVGVVLEWILLVKRVFKQLEQLEQLRRPPAPAHLPEGVPGERRLLAGVTRL